MRVGQRVCFKPASCLAASWYISPDAQGTVMCSYQKRASSPGVAERLDVRFTSRIVIWGGAADEFEEVADIQELPNAVTPVPVGNQIRTYDGVIRRELELQECARWPGSCRGHSGRDMRHLVRTVQYQAGGAR